MTRRKALTTLAASAAIVATTRSASAAPQAQAASADTGKPAGYKHSACKWCYKKLSLDEMARIGREIGLHSIELLDPKDWPTVQKYGLTCALANGTMTIKDGLNRVENHAKFVPSMIKRIEECADAGIPSVICFSGNRAGMPDEQGLENCAVGLKQIVGAAEKRGVTVIMELLNSKLNHKDYMCDRTGWGVELCKKVGSERFKLLYDIYHMQIMEGDVIATIQTHHKYIGHYHTGGNPGRAEIDESQELNYAAIMRAIKGTGYTGFVGQEFVPKNADPIASLKAAIKLCTV